MNKSPKLSERDRRRWHLSTEGQRPSSLTVGGLATPQRQRQWTMTYILPQQANSQVAYCRSTGQNAVTGAVNKVTLSQTGHGGGNSDTWARPVVIALRAAATHGQRPGKYLNSFSVYLKPASVYSKEFYVGIPWSLSLSERSKDSYLRAVCEHGRPIPRISFKLAPFQQEKTNGKQIEA